MPRVYGKTPGSGGGFMRLEIIIVAMAETGSLFDAMLTEFEEAAKLLSLEPGIWRILTHPKRQIIVSCPVQMDRSEEHTSELQSPCNLVCRLLLEKKKAHQSLVCPYLSTNIPTGYRPLL